MGPGPAGPGWLPEGCGHFPRTERASVPDRVLPGLCLPRPEPPRGSPQGPVEPSGGCVTPLGPAWIIAGSLFQGQVLRPCPQPPSRQGPPAEMTVAARPPQAARPPGAPRPHVPREGCTGLVHTCQHTWAGTPPPASGGGPCLWARPPQSLPSVLAQRAPGSPRQRASRKAIF